MLELSDIQSSQEELQDYYTQLRTQHVTPAWLNEAVSVAPQSSAVPYLWHWRDLRPQAMRAAELVGDAGRDRARPSPFRGGLASDHRGKGWLYGR